MNSSFMPAGFRWRFADRTAAVCRGFTLIELLVVIAIISLLAALIAPAVMSSMARAYEASCRSNQRQIAMAMMMSADDNNGYFPSVGSLGESYFGRQDVLLKSLEGSLAEDYRIWFCPHAVKKEKASPVSEFADKRIGYFYWAWSLENGAPAAIRPESPENIWMIQGWNRDLGQLVLLTDHFRDKAYWSINDDWQYHGNGVEVPLSQPGTLAVMGDGSVQKIAPRP